MLSDSEGTRAILDFWFREIGPDGWWMRSAETDAAIAERFGDLWARWRERTPDSFLASADDALAGVILFDQFSRNLFRGHADAFSTDSLALAIAKGAIDRGVDSAMSGDGLSFLYMPFQHSEDIADQRRSMALFTALGAVDALEYARDHYDIIERFGRFPARNVALGRADRTGEADAIRSSKDW